MRIVYIITRPVIGGAQSNVRDLLAGFHQTYDVHLATSEEGPLTTIARNLGVPVHLLPSLRRQINPLGDVRSVRECAALLRSIEPDLVHAHSSKAGIVARLAGRIVGVPVVFTAHGWGFIPGAPTWRRAIAWLSEKSVAPLAARLICVSDADRRLAFRAGVGDARSLVTIRNGIDAMPSSMPPPLADPATEPPRFVMVARFEEPKRQDLLIEAFALAVRQGDERAPRAALEFVGDGAGLEHCAALTRRHSIADSVTFLGDRHDVPDLLARAQGFVLTSRYEALPISVLEAMRAGLPVIATAVGGVLEEVVDGETGLLVPKGDATALATALRTLIDSPALRGRMGAAGRQRFLEAFTLEQMVAQTDAV